MSSLDLHTHFPFQLTLPEAIAIVCAPNSEPSIGVFRLTDPYGIEYIGQCQDQRLFHPHETTIPLYEDINNQTLHARFVSKTVELVDLRSKK